MVPVRYLAYALGLSEDGVYWVEKVPFVYLYAGDVGLALSPGEREIGVLRGADAEAMSKILSLLLLVDSVQQSNREPTNAELAQMLEYLSSLASFFEMETFETEESLISGLDKLGEKISSWLEELEKKSETIEMDTVPVLMHDRVFLPARYVAEALGYEVTWEPEGQKVVLSPGGRPEPAGPDDFHGQESPPSPSGNEGSRSVITAVPEKVAVYRYAGGVMVGVEGKNWFLSLSGGNPALLTVTDPETGKKRTYSPSSPEWKQDPVVVRFGLAGFIQGVIEGLERDKIIQQTQQWQEWYQQQQIQKLEQDLERQRIEEQRRWAEEEQRRRMEEQRRIEEQRRWEQNLVNPPVTQPYTPPTYTPTVPYTPPAYTPSVPSYSPALPWSPGGTRW